MEFLSDPNTFAMLHCPKSSRIDNIILDPGKAARAARQARLGLGFAMVSRLMLLFTLSWVMA
jgi:hypothetical protein